MSYDKEQARLAQQNSASLGNLVVKEGLLTSYEFQELFTEFSKQTVDELLGQFLVRKDVLTEEKLEFLLIKQEAIANGGVEDIHVARALKIADRARERVSRGIDNLVACADEAEVKVAGG